MQWSTPLYGSLSRKHHPAPFLKEYPTLDREMVHDYAWFENGV